MFDVKKRKSLKGVTVGELVQIMLDLPQEAIVNFCGKNQVNEQLSPQNKAFPRIS